MMHGANMKITQNNFRMYNAICISKHDKLKKQADLTFFFNIHLLIIILTYLWSNVLSFIYKKFIKNVSIAKWFCGQIKFGNTSVYNEH